MSLVPRTPPLLEAHLLVDHHFFFLSRVHGINRFGTLGFHRVSPIFRTDRSVSYTNRPGYKFGSRRTESSVPRKIGVVMETILNIPLPHTLRVLGWGRETARVGSGLVYGSGSGTAVTITSPAKPPTTSPTPDSSVGRITPTCVPPF